MFFMFRLRFATERVTSINTAVADGNASLLALDDKSSSQRTKFAYADLY
jgi:hypothetical protein